MSTTATSYHQHAKKKSTMSDTSIAEAATSRFDVGIHGQWQPQQGRSMENFTAMVMKFATSDPTRPFTDDRKALIEKRLREEFPHFRTPNHPPYAAMIERAIQELKEPEGCTEESISTFITKHYDDLPWCHSTLLKHHLVKLCECGEISVTSENHYLLAHGITNLNSAPSSTSDRQIQRNKKQFSKKLSGRARRNRKRQTEGKTQQEEQMEVIHGQDQGKEFHNVVVEYQNLAEEQHQEINADLYALQAQEQEQQIVLIGDQNHVEGKIMDLEHVEMNQPEVLSLDRPPDFNVELQRQKLPDESLLECQQKNPEYKPETMATSISLHNSKQTQMEQQHQHSSSGLPAKLQLVEEEQQPDFFNPERPLEPYTHQKPCKSLVTSTSLSLPMHSEQPSQCKLALLNSGVSEANKSVAGEVDEVSHTLQLVLEEGRQQRCQSQRQYDDVQQKAHTTMQLAVRSEPLESLEKLPETQQQVKQRVRKGHAKSNQQFEFPIAEKSLIFKLATGIPSLEEQLQRGKLCVKNKVSKSLLPMTTVSLHLPEELDFMSRGKMSQTECLQQRLKQDDGRMRTRSKSKTMGTEDVSMCSGQLAELPNPEHHRGPKPRPVKPCSKVKVQREKPWEGNEAPQYLLLALEAVTADCGVQKDLKKQPNVSASEQLSDTKSGRQHWDRGGKPFTSTPPMTSKANFSLSEVQYKETQLPNEESPSGTKQKPMEESTQTTEQQAKLRVQGKCPSILVTPQQSKLPSPEREPQVQHLTLEKSQKRQLRPRPPTSDQLKPITTEQYHKEVEQDKTSEQSTRAAAKKGASVRTIYLRPRKK